MAETATNAFEVRATVRHIPMSTQKVRLVVSEIWADEGPRHRKAPHGGRFAGRGRFRPIVRRSSHITVVLAERESN